MARSGEGFGRGRTGGPRGGKGEELDGENGSCGGGNVCGGEACNTELGGPGFLSFADVGSLSQLKPCSSVCRCLMPSRDVDAGVGENSSDTMPK